MSILAFTEAAIDRYEQLRKLKLGVKANDLRIAAIAIDKSAIVVTRNRVDFGRVPDLQIENWME
jgi:tRNA(fMet)-specific endonuclease VapC